MVFHAASARAGLRAEITDYGEVTADQERPARPTRQDHTLTGRTTITGIRYVSHADTLPAQLCLRFGVSIRLVADAGEELPQRLIVVSTHPRITRPDGASGVQDSFPTPVIGDTAYAGWTFDQSWEQQPGDWTIAFMFEGKVITSKTFTITAPGTPRSVCLPDAIS